MHKWVEIDHSSDLYYTKLKTVIVADTILNTAGPGLFTSTTFGIRRGTDDDRRTGRQVTVKRIRLVGAYFPSASTTSNMYWGNTVGLAIVYDRQSNGTQATWGDVMSNNYAFSACTENPERFTMIYHGIACIQPYAFAAGPVLTTGTGDQRIPFFIEKEVDLPIIFNNLSTTDATSIVSGNLLFFFGSFTTARASVQYEWEVNFYDK